MQKVSAFLIKIFMSYELLIMSYELNQLMLILRLILVSPAFKVSVNGDSPAFKALVDDEN